jgi:hypothetical protein
VATRGIGNATILSKEAMASKVIVAIMRSKVVVAATEPKELLQKCA